MGILSDIKAEAAAKGVKIQTSEERDLEHKINNLFYLEKNIDKEIEFLRNVMTRGQETAERKGLHASAIIKSDEGFCYRQQVLSLFYHQLQGEDLPVATRRIFAEGDAVHEKIQRLFIRGGYSDPLDLDVTYFVEEFDLFFSPDIFCKIDGENYIGEIKSMNGNAYNNMIRDGVDHPSAPKQLQLYMCLSEFVKPEQVRKGFVLCENKNTQDFKVTLYNYDPDAVRPYMERLEKIRKYKDALLKRGRIVSRKNTCTAYTCKIASSCPMRDVCWGRTKQKL